MCCAQCALGCLDLPFECEDFQVARARRRTARITEPILREYKYKAALDQVNGGVASKASRAALGTFAAALPTIRVPVHSHVE
jgi:hypothetical protein